MTELSSTPVDIAVSGLRAQAMRMHVIANNIANAQTTNTGNGEPFRRKMVEFFGDNESVSGVEIGDVVPDYSTDLKKVRMPGHPDADENGWVRMPNIDMPIEMMNMVTASRAYQAATAVLKRYQDLTDTTLELLR